jgi:hypothetical protein
MLNTCFVFGLCFSMLNTCFVFGLFFDAEYMLCLNSFLGHTGTSTYHLCGNAHRSKSGSTSVCLVRVTVFSMHVRVSKPQARMSVPEKRICL